MLLIGQQMSLYQYTAHRLWSMLVVAPLPLVHS